MIKTICCLGSAALGVALLSACGSTDAVTLDTSILSKGDNNAITSGGYWWTYTDHQPQGNQYHATIDPITSQKVGLKPVVDEDAAHGNVIRAKGEIPPALVWDDVRDNCVNSSQCPPATVHDGCCANACVGETDATACQLKQDATVDPYWQSLYSDSRVPNYPSAGLGFGYKKDNAPYDATQGKKFVGIAFDMKTNIEGMQGVYVSMPTVDTDLNDPSNGDNGDLFQHTCTYYSDKILPGATQPNRPTNDSGVQTCFIDYRKAFLVDPLAEEGDYGKIDRTGAKKWARYCVLFSEVGPSKGSNQTSRDAMKPFDPTTALKVKFDFFQPAETDAAAAKFDLSVDNVQLITAEQAKDPANYCNPDFLSKEYGKGAVQ